MSGRYNYDQHADIYQRLYMTYMYSFELYVVTITIILHYIYLYTHSLTHTRTQANVTGRSAKTVREYLEKHYSSDAVKTRDDTIILAIKALLEVVQSGSKSMELAVMERGKPIEVYTHDVMLFQHSIINPFNFIF